MLIATKKRIRPKVGFFSMRKQDKSQIHKITAKKE
jgi:hypothetical protein